MKKLFLFLSLFLTLNVFSQYDNSALDAIFGKPLLDINLTNDNKNKPYYSNFNNQIDNNSIFENTTYLNSSIETINKKEKESPLSILFSETLFTTSNGNNNGGNTGGGILDNNGNNGNGNGWGTDGNEGNGNGNGNNGNGHGHEHGNNGVPIEMDFSVYIFLSSLCVIYLQFIKKINIITLLKTLKNVQRSNN